MKNDISRCRGARNPVQSVVFEPAVANAAWLRYRELRLREAADPRISADPEFQAEVASAYDNFLNEFGE